MNDETKDILPGNNAGLNEQTLIDYVNDRLPAEEKLQMDKLMAESGLVNDVVEGLKQFKNPANLTLFVDQLNAGLHKQLQKKKQRKRKLTFKTGQWIYLAVIIIILLALIGFIIIRGLGS